VRVSSPYSKFNVRSAFHWPGAPLTGSSISRALLRHSRPSLRPWDWRLSKPRRAVKARCRSWLASIADHVVAIGWLPLPQTRQRVAREPLSCFPFLIHCSCRLRSQPTNTAYTTEDNNTHSLKKSRLNRNLSATSSNESTHHAMASVIRKPLTRFHRLASLGSKHAGKLAPFVHS
jgi:hypothetical protein